MPISTTAGELIWWLACDADKPIETRPVFLCRPPVRGLMKQYQPLVEEARAIGQGPELYERLHQMISLGVTGWRNVGDRPFTREALDELLTNDELIELAIGWPSAFKLMRAEREAAAAAAEPSITSAADATAADAGKSSV